MEQNNLKELVRLLESLKKAYVRELKNGNTVKAEQIKKQMPRIISEIKKIKESAQISGETVNIDRLEDQFTNNIQTIEEEVEYLEEEPYEEIEYVEEVEYLEEEPYEEIEYIEEETSPKNISKNNENKSIKQIKKELKKEKKELKKIAKIKNKEKKIEEKELKKQAKETQRKINEAKRRRKRKKSSLNERIERFKAQRKEPKIGTIVLFILLISILFLSLGRGYIMEHARVMKYYDRMTDYYAMYNFFLKFISLMVLGIVIIFTYLSSDLTKVNQIRLLSIITAILMFISYDGIPYINIKILDGSHYLILPGLCLIILIHLIGINIVRDKIHYDYDY